jgi:hypothetical protein
MLGTPLKNSYLEEKYEKWEELLEERCKEAKEARDYFSKQ